MTEIDRTKEWTVDGVRFGYRQHVSPWGHGVCWATVNLDTGEVVATESAYDFGEGEVFTAAASCMPHSLVVPPGTLKGESDGGREEDCEHSGGGGCTVECKGAGGGLSGSGGDSQTFTASGPWTPAVDAEGGTGGTYENGGDHIYGDRDEFRHREAVMTGTDPGPTPGICYPGDDGSEPPHIRGHKAADYAERVRREADAARDEISRLLYGDEKPKRSRWEFFFAPRISLIGAMIYVTLGILLGTILAANAKSADGCPKGTQFYCWTDPVTLVMHCSCS